MTGIVGAFAPDRDENDPRLVDTITALRDEIAGLRQAGQLRAILEQAKGVLMERHRISSDEAFARLRALSQQHNVRVVEVAATVVGVTVPKSELPLERIDEVIRGHLPASVSASRVWRDFRGQSEVSAGVVGALLDVVASGTERGEEAGDLLGALLKPFDVAGVVLYRRMSDQSLSLIGSSGVPADVLSPWRRIPPVPEIPFIATVEARRSFFWSDLAERSLEFPSVGNVSSEFDASATVPVFEGDEPVGVVGLMWVGRREFTEEVTSSITDLVQRVARMLLRTATSADPELHWLDAILRLHLDPWVLLDIVPSADGQIRDLVVVDAATTAPEAHAALGQRVLAAWPFLANDGTMGALSRLAGSGGFWSDTVGSESSAPWGRVGTKLRATRLGRRLIMVWHAPPSS